MTRICSVAPSEPILAMVSAVEWVRNAIQTSTRGHHPTLLPAGEVAIAPPRRTPSLQAVWIAGAADCAGWCGNNHCQTEADQRSQDYAAHSNFPPTRHLIAFRGPIHRSSLKLLNAGWHGQRHRCGRPCHQNDPNTVPRTRTAASTMMHVTITVITISR